MITQAPYLEDSANLPNRSHVLGVYTKLKDGSCNVVIIIKNGTAKPIHVVSARVIDFVMAANTVPELEELGRTFEEVGCRGSATKEKAIYGGMSEVTA